MMLSQVEKQQPGYLKIVRKTGRSFWMLLGSVSVRTKILGIVLSLMLLLGAGMTVLARVAMQAALWQRLEEQSVVNGRDLAARATELILINDHYALHELVNGTNSNNPDVQYAFIVGVDGKILAHTFGNGFPVKLLEANRISTLDPHRTVMLETDVGRVWDTAVPIFDGQAGTARIGMSEKSVNEALNGLTKQLLVTLVVVAVVGVAAGVLLTWIVTRPILQLNEATQAVGQGDFSQRVDPWAEDEIGALAEAFNTMIDGLAQAELAQQERDTLRTRLLDKVISAQEDERKRIARELHDETGQALTTLLILLQKMKQECPLPELKPQVEEIGKLIMCTLDDVRNLALELRPSTLDDLGLAAALRQYIRDYRRRYPFLDVDIALVHLDEVRLPAAVETALYRIVQESLTNIVRHAKATTASVFVEQRNGRVRALIEDNGQGFDPSQFSTANRQLGIYGMCERAELLGGKLAIETAPGNGTSILVEVPT